MMAAMILVRRALHEFVASKQYGGVTVPQGDVIHARRPRFQSDGLANHERDGLGFRFASVFGRARATIGVVETLVC